MHTITQSCVEADFVKNTLDSELEIYKKVFLAENWTQWDDTLVATIRIFVNDHDVSVSKD